MPVPASADRVRHQSRTLHELLQRQDALSEAEEREATTLPDRICRQMLVAPDEVHRAVRRFLATLDA